jgi:DNA-binding CsgD family transcriptional regulator
MDQQEVRAKRTLARFGHDIAALSDAALLTAALGQALKAFGFAAFNYGYGKLTDGGGLIAQCIWSTLDPAWIQHYAANRYYRDDRLVRAALVSVAPFRYEDIFSTAPRSSRQLEMEQRFGYRSGVIVPLHGPGTHFGILSAAASKRADHPAIGANTIAAIQYIGAVFDEHVRKLGLPGSPAVLEIPPISLLEREKQCLTWAAAGKTNHEIGIVLKISARTAKKYIESAMRKLDATNRAQAAARATALGLIES